ncbi:hypothetical protein DFH08DRAFT_887456 [Mycena albidolilacea]|uniref:Uncharacterized protein n=1 Tax=Mycena albidolilacea TaxID=1033008 RepID=A0AAD7EI71_9AGAR|nr:hypothetical protein DFH08DRAFT_887456 [Mycena albidolilacea]
MTWMLPPAKYGLLWLPATIIRTALGAFMLMIHADDTWEHNLFLIFVIVLLCIQAIQFACCLTGVYFLHREFHRLCQTLFFVMALSMTLL